MAKRKPNVFKTGTTTRHILRAQASFRRASLTVASHRLPQLKLPSVQPVIDVHTVVELICPAAFTQLTRVTRRHFAESACTTRRRVTRSCPAGRWKPIEEFERFVQGRALPTDGEAANASWEHVFFTLNNLTALLRDQWDIACATDFCRGSRMV